MASQWIDALTARQIVGELGSIHQAERLICKRANAGLIKARAELILVGDVAQNSRDIPKGFWWAQGELALEQDWATGDFSTWIEKKHEIRVFGVEFDLIGVLEALPVERRGAVAARFSVAGNHDWVCADAAIRMIAPHSMRPAYNAETKLIEAARLGFVACRAVEALAGPQGFVAWRWQEREWDVPTWFWEHYTGSDSSSRSFEQNTARGRGRGPIGSYMQLNGIHFWRADVVRHFNLAEAREAGPESVDSGDDATAKLPRLAESKLQEWWAAKAAVSESLKQEELLALIRAAFPDNHIARDRIRALSAGRKRGPKPIGDKASAK